MIRWLRRLPLLPSSQHLGRIILLVLILAAVLLAAGWTEEELRTPLVLQTYRTVLSLLVLLIGSRIVQELAAKYQEKNKEKEFRFAALQKAAAVYHSLYEKAFAVMCAKGLFVAAVRTAPPGSPKITTLEARLEKRKREFDEAMAGMFPLISMHTVLFAPDTQNLWGEVVNILMKFPPDDFRTGRDMLREAHDKYRAFFARAATELPLPYSTVEIEDVETYEEEIESLLSQIDEARPK